MSLLTAVHGRGTTAAKPAAAAANEGYIYYDTTLSRLERSNGATWDVIEGASGAVATDVIWDAKGDLAGGTGANTAVRLAVGTNGQVLTADSAEATGMKWAAAASAFNGSRATISGNPSIADATWTAVALATETYDSGTWHDTVTNNSRMTVPTGVTRVQVHGLVGFTAAANGARYVTVRKNGAIYGAAHVINGNTSITNGAPSLPYSDIIAVVATDYLELYVYQDSGGAVTLSLGQLAVMAVG